MVVFCGTNGRIPIPGVPEKRLQKTKKLKSRLPSINNKESYTTAVIIKKSKDTMVMPA